MIKILSGEMAIELHLQFLIRNNNTDLMILKNTKVKLIWPKERKIFSINNYFALMSLTDTAFSGTPGCSPKFSLPHGHGHCQLVHAHGDNERPVPQVTHLYRLPYLVQINCWFGLNTVSMTLFIYTYSFSL